MIIYEITRLKTRHARLREVLLPAQAQSLDVFSDGRLCVGYQSGFTIYSLMGDQHPLSLVHPDNQMLGFLAYSPVDALGAIELPRGEFLLVFNTLGVYVDLQVCPPSLLLPLPPPRVGSRETWRLCTRRPPLASPQHTTDSCWSTAKPILTCLTLLLASGARLSTSGRLGLC